MSDTLNAIVAEWIREDAKAAREHDPDVGIFRNEEMAELFDHLANEVEAGESQAQRILALEAALHGCLRREREHAEVRGFSDCACMSLSRKAESEYETGLCPHQVARALLHDSQEVEVKVQWQLGDEPEPKHEEKKE